MHQRRPPSANLENTTATLEPLTVRIPVAVQITEIGRSKLYELIKAGEVETVKVGTATLVKMASLRRLTEHGAA